MTLSSRTLGAVLSEHDNDYTELETRASMVTDRSRLFNADLRPLQPNGTAPLRTTVVIPAWNASDTILSCLTSLEQSSFNRQYQQLLEVVVIDDGSADDTWDLLVTSDLSLHLLLLRQEHSGQSRALNNGIAMSHGDLIVSCDADMILTEYALESMVRMYDFDTSLVVAGFRSEVNRLDPRINSGYLRQYGPPPIPTFVGDQRISFHALGHPDNMCVTSDHFKQYGHMRGLWMPNDIQCKDPWLLTDMVFGALFALHKKTYERIGGYDERLQGWGCADTLVTAKAIASGNKVVPLYSAAGFHVSHESRTPDKWSEYTRNRQLFKQHLAEQIVDEYPDYLRMPGRGIIEILSREPQGLAVDRRELSDVPHNHLGTDVPRHAVLFALGHYDDCLREIASAAPSLSNSATRVLEGRALLALGRAEEAEEIFAELSVGDSRGAHVLTYLAMARAASGRFRAAREALDGVLQGGYTDVDLAYWLAPTETHILRGDKYVAQGFLEVARRCYEVALAVDPANPIAATRWEECLGDSK